MIGRVSDKNHVFVTCTGPVVTAQRCEKPLTSMRTTRMATLDYVKLCFAVSIDSQLLCSCQHCQRFIGSDGSK